MLHVYGAFRGSEDNRIGQAIELTENFFRELGIKTRFRNTELAKNNCCQLCNVLHRGGGRLAKTGVSMQKKYEKFSSIDLINPVIAMKTDLNKTLPSTSSCCY